MSPRRRGRRRRPPPPRPSLRPRGRDDRGDLADPQGLFDPRAPLCRERRRDRPHRAKRPRRRLRRGQGARRPRRRRRLRSARPSGAASRRAARAWLARNPWAVDFTLRGDAVFVAPGRLPRHAPAAYRLDDRLIRPSLPDRTAHAPHRRRSDGPDRAHPHRGRFRPSRCCSRRRRAATGCCITRPTACGSAARASRPWPSRSRCGTSRATMPGSASRASSTFRPSTSCCCARTRRSTSPMSTTTHLLERIHPATLVVNDPRSVRDAPEKLFVMDFPELMPPTLIARDRAAIEAFRAEHGEVVMKPLYGFGGAAVFKVGRAGPEFRLAVRPVHRHPARALGHPEVPAARSPRATSASFWSTARRMGAVNRVPAGDDIRSNMVRGGAARETELTDARAGDLRADRPGAEAARPRLRRHRRDRRLSDGNQRHLPDRHPRDQAARRPGPRGCDLGRDRGPPRGNRVLSVRTACGSQPEREYTVMSAVAAAVVERRPRSPRASQPVGKGLDRAKLHRRARGASRGPPATTPRSGARRSRSAGALDKGRAEARSGARSRRHGTGLRRDPERPDRRSPARRARSGRALARARSTARRRRRSSRSAATAAACWRRAPTSTSCSCCRTSRRPAVEKVVEALLYVLWDLKQKVGHATRTVDECLQAGARRHDDPHHADRGAARHRRPRRCSRRCRRASTRRSSPGPRPNSSPPSSPSARSASSAPARRAISSSPTSRRARGACATSTRCSGSRNTSIACRTRTTWSPPACSRRANSRCSGAARSSSGRCAAGCISSPAAPRSA